MNELFSVLLSALQTLSPSQKVIISKKAENIFLVEGENVDNLGVPYKYEIEIRFFLNDQKMPNSIFDIINQNKDKKDLNNNPDKKENLILEELK